MKSGLLYIGNENLHNELLSLINNNNELICFDISSGNKEKMIHIVLDNHLRELCDESIFVQISLAVAYAEAYGCDRLYLPYDNKILNSESENIIEYISKLKELVRIGTMNKMELVFLLCSNVESVSRTKREPIIVSDKYMVLFSGGIDCTVAAVMLKNQKKHVKLINFEYGQKNTKEETLCLSNTMKQFGFDCIKVNIKNFYDEIKFSSGLLNEIIQLSLENKNLEYVPFRNTIFFAIALIYSKKYGIGNITSGSQCDDMISPDNSPEYYKALRSFIKSSLKYSDIEIKSVLDEIGGKKEIIAYGTKQNVNFNYCWTCHCAGIYIDGEVYQCGICSDCHTRYKAFKHLGLTDPIKYQVLPVI